MKKNNLKMFMKILAIFIICLISFIGIYVPRLNSMKNIVKDYQLADDLKGYREVYFEVGSSASDDLKTEQNFENAKSIIEKRLEIFGVENYNLSLDNSTGNMYLQLSENEMTDTIISNIRDTGKIEFRDSEDGTVLLDNSKVQEVRRGYSTNNEGTIVYIEIQLNKEGTEIYKELTGTTYAKIPENDENTTTEQNNDDTDAGLEENLEVENDEIEQNNEENIENEGAENTENAEETEIKQKELTISISGQDVITTSFDKVVEDGIIDLSLNKATQDATQINDYLISASTILIALNNGPLPFEYSISGNQYVESNIKLNTVIYILSFFAGIIVLRLIYMIIKYKGRGLLGAISFVVFLAVYLLLIRYTNVEISIESIVGIIIALNLNYWFNMNLLNVKKENISEYYKKYTNLIIKLIPIFGISIMFSFMNWLPINTFGMTFMWGIVLIVAYNRFVTKNMVDLIDGTK